MSQERSAEWLIDGLRAIVKWHGGDATGCNPQLLLDRIDELLSAAEAREAGEPKQSVDQKLDEALDRIYAKYGPRLDLFFADVDKAREASQPTAAEVITAAENLVAQELRQKQGFGDTDNLRRLRDLIDRWKEANGGK